MPTHKLRCPYCRKRIRVTMDTATNRWTFIQHYNPTLSVTCPGSGRAA